LKADVENYSDILIESGLPGIKNIQDAFKQTDYVKHFKNKEYVEREEDEELKALWEKEVKSTRNLAKDLGITVDA